MKNKKASKKITEISAAFPTPGMPENPAEMINDYGTYEVQKTADTENPYPAIAQGITPDMKSRTFISHKNKTTPKK